MAQWYFIESGEQRGPFDEARILGMLSDKQLEGTTLAWKEGMSDWTALREIPAFNLSPYAPPVAQPDAVWDDSFQSGPQVRPWIRYWARSFDLALFGALVGIVLEFTYPQALEIPDALFGIVLAALFIFFEAALLAMFGTTPFKAFFNIRIRNINGNRLEFLEGLHRAFHVWLRGLGMGIPLVSLVCNYTSYQRLTASGSTSWDADGGYVITHRTIGIVRILLLILVAMAFTALIFYGMQASFDQ